MVGKKFRSILGVASALTVGLFVAPQMSINVVAQGPSRYIVTFRPGTDRGTRAKTVANHGAALRFNYSGVDAAAVAVPNDSALAALVNDPSVMAVVPDRLVSAYQDVRGNAKASGKPGGGGGASQVVPAGVTRVGASTTLSNGDSIGVAIVDTGIDLGHPDLGSPVDAFSASTARFIAPTPISLGSVAGVRFGTV